MYSPPLLIHRAQRFFQFWNASWNVFCRMARRSLIEFSSVSSTVRNRRPISEDFNFGNKCYVIVLTGDFQCLGKVPSFLVNKVPVVVVCNSMILQHRSLKKTSEIRAAVIEDMKSKSAIITACQLFGPRRFNGL